jgi:hypothetical protein
MYLDQLLLDLLLSFRVKYENCWFQQIQNDPEEPGHSDFRVPKAGAKSLFTLISGFPVIHTIVLSSFLNTKKRIRDKHIIIHFTARGGGYSKKDESEVVNNKFSGKCTDNCCCANMVHYQLIVQYVLTVHSNLFLGIHKSTNTYIHVCSKVYIYKYLRSLVF